MRRQPWRTTRCSSACRMPGRLVDEQAGDAGRRDRDAGERQRRQARAQLGHGRRAEEVAERAAQDDGAVEAALVAQVEHEVAVDAVAARRAQHAAREHRRCRRRGGRRPRRCPASSVVWYGLAQRIDQHADAGPLAPPQPRRRPDPAAARGWARSGRASAFRYIGITGTGSAGLRVSSASVKPAAGQAPVAPRDGGRIRGADSDDLRDRRAGRLARAARGARRGAADPPGRAPGLQAGDRGDVAGRLRARRRCRRRSTCRSRRSREAYLFYAGIVSAGFDICDDAGGDRRQPRRARRCASRCRRRASCRSTSCASRPSTRSRGS